MRTEKEILDMILETADADARIRAVTMEGSRANPNAVHDEYSDFDITFFVTDVREFTRDKEWIHRLVPRTGIPTLMITAAEIPSLFLYSLLTGTGLTLPCGMWA